MPRLRSFAIVAGCLGLSLVGFACGDAPPRDKVTTSTTPADRRLTPTNIITSKDIRATKPGTPERKIMEWAQAVQFGDTRAVRAAYTTRVRNRVPLARFIAATDQVAAALARPEFVRPIYFRGTYALVRVMLVSFGGDGQRSEQPTTFRVHRENGRWLLDDASLLLDTAAALQRSRR